MTRKVKLTDAKEISSQNSQVWNGKPINIIINNLFVFLIKKILLLHGYQSKFFVDYFIKVCVKYWR